MIWILALPIILYFLGVLFQHASYVIKYIEIVYLPFGVMVILVFLGILFLYKFYQITFVNFIVIFIPIWILIYTVATYTAWQYIYNIAIKKYHTEPEYIKIEFGYEYRRPHSILIKNGKVFYWSFQKRDFIENKEIRKWL